MHKGKKKKSRKGTTTTRSLKSRGKDKAAIDQGNQG